MNKHHISQHMIRWGNHSNIECKFKISANMRNIVVAWRLQNSWANLETVHIDKLINGESKLLLGVRKLSADFELEFEIWINSLSIFYQIICWENSTMLIYIVSFFNTVFWANSFKFSVVRPAANFSKFMLTQHKTRIEKLRTNCMKI